MKVRGRRIEGDVAGGYLTVRFKLQHILDPNDVSAIMKEVEAAFGKYRATRIVLNFSGVRQISSQMLGKVLQLKKLAEGRKGDLRVCNLTGNALEAFRLCGFGKLVKVYKSEADALAD